MLGGLAWLTQEELPRPSQELTRLGYTTFILDATEAQKRLAPELASMDKERRIETAHRFSYVARLLNECGGVAIVPFIVPWREGREEARKEVSRFAEVYVECPMEVCEKRDDKGRWAAARSKGAHFVAGDDFEPPLAPAITVHTDKQTPQQSLASILEGLERRGFVQR